MEIPLTTLKTYYNTALYMFDRGYTSEAEFKEVASKVLLNMGYPPHAIDTIVTEALERARVIEAFERTR